jgi:hypothetical protein
LEARNRNGRLAARLRHPERVFLNDHAPQKVRRGMAFEALFGMGTELPISLKEVGHGRHG